MKILHDLKFHSKQTWLLTNLFHLLLVITLPLLFWAYSPIYTKEEYFYSRQLLILGEIDRPFVYRQFIPVIAKLMIHVFNVSTDAAILLTLVLLFFGFAYSFRYLYSAFWERTTFSDLILIFGVIIIFIGVHGVNMKFYDVGSIFFFTLSLGLLANSQITKFLILFPLASLNKETSVLLILFYIIYYFYRQKRSTYFPVISFLLVTYSAIFISIRFIFRNNPGSYLFRPLDNIQGYVESPYLTAILAFAFVTVNILIFYKWHTKPYFLRMNYLILFPPLFILHIVMGKSFELRVFTEIYPIIVLLAISTLHAINYNRKSSSTIT